MRPLRLGFAAFLVGLVAVAIAFAIDYGPHNPASYFVFAAVVFAVVLGFVSIVWGWVNIAQVRRKVRGSGERPL